MNDIQDFYTGSKAYYLLSDEILSDSRIKLFWSEFYALLSEWQLKSGIIVP